MMQLMALFLFFTMLMKPVIATIEEPSHDPVCLMETASVLSQLIEAGKDPHNVNDAECNDAGGKILSYTYTDCVEEELNAAWIFCGGNSCSLEFTDDFVHPPGCTPNIVEDRVRLLIENTSSASAIEIGIALIMTAGVCASFNLLI